MTRILFVCLGNICRSPMAEFIMKDMLEKAGRKGQFEIASAGTSGEESGNPVYPKARERLREAGISSAGKTAVQLQRGDYEKYDYLIGMEQSNVSGIRRICGGDPDGKVYRLLDFTAHPRDIADPWFTGDFESTYGDLCEGCGALLAYLSDGRRDETGEKFRALRGVCQKQDKRG